MPNGPLATARCGPKTKIEVLGLKMFGFWTTSDGVYGLLLAMCLLLVGLGDCNICQELNPGKLHTSALLTVLFKLIFFCGERGLHLSVPRAYTGSTFRDH